MSRNRKKTSKENKENHVSRKLFLYSPTAVQNALAAVQNGTSVFQASKMYRVPRSTLRHKLKGEAPLTSGRVGPESILGPHVEKIFVDWLLEACKRGFPINKDGLVGSVKKFIESEGIKSPFKNNTPGRKWFDGFLKRHPILSIKKAEYLSKTRAAISEKFIRKWFTEVQLLLKDNLEVFEDSTRVFNMDETAMYLAPKGGLFVAEKGKPTYDVSASSDKENITTLFTVNAAGEILPPLTVYKYERLPKSCVDAAPPGWGIGKTENGWMTYVTFYEYFTNVFNPYLEEKEIKKPVIVFLDGHVSHMSYHLSIFCKEHQIILCCLPPNATHLLQPLDVSVFAPLKKHWLKLVKKWRIEHNGLDIQKFDVPAALSSIITKDDFENTIKAGFRRCGLYPFDPDAVNYERCIKQTNSSNFNEREQSTTESLSKQLSLEYFEKNIDKNILKQFKDLKKNNLDWTGAIEYSALFNTWNKMYTNAYSEEKILDETSQSNDTPNLDLEEHQIILHGTYNNIYKITQFLILDFFK